MPIQVIPLPAFDDNYIWMIRSGQDVVAVDPGDAAPVEAWLREHDLALRAVLVTHHHGDHVGGLKALLARWKVPVYGPASEAIEAVTTPVLDGERGVLPGVGLDFSVIGVPGHTLDHVAYLVDMGPDESSCLFCGDTLFASGCGRLFEGSPAQMLGSLDRLAALDPDTRVCCAHEYTLSNIAFALACEPDNPQLLAWHDEARALRAAGLPTVPTTIGLERQRNPFLRADRPDVQQRLAELHGGPVADRLAAFTLMREWKNRFRAA